MAYCGVLDAKNNASIRSYFALVQASGNEEFEEEEVDSDDDDIPEPTKEVFYCQEIQVRGLPEGQGVPTQVILQRVTPSSLRHLVGHLSWTPASHLRL